MKHHLFKMKTKYIYSVSNVTQKHWLTAKILFTLLLMLLPSLCHCPFTDSTRFPQQPQKHVYSIFHTSSLWTAQERYCYFQQLQVTFKTKVQHTICIPNTWKQLEFYRTHTLCVLSPVSELGWTRVQYYNINATLGIFRTNFCAVLIGFHSA